jgi:NDP-sugar pyrophosphorylase family protein
MAGRGKRFIDHGYTFPKFLIDINGKPIIQMIVENLNIQGKYIFVVLKEHFEQYLIIAAVLLR